MTVTVNLHSGRPLTFDLAHESVTALYRGRAIAFVATDAFRKSKEGFHLTADNDPGFYLDAENLALIQSLIP